MSKQYPFQSSEQLATSIARHVREVVERIDTFGFTVWPFAPDPDNCIPVGFCTIGLTRIGLPEIYVSGISPNSREGEAIIEQVRRIHTFTTHEPAHVPVMELCTEVNQMMASEPDVKVVHQWRPVNPDRLMYGQATMIRFWAEREGLLEKVQGIQIVHRQPDGHFPYISTPEQLLLDWNPYGTNTFLNVKEVVADVPAI